MQNHAPVPAHTKTPVQAQTRTPLPTSNKQPNLPGANHIVTNTKNVDLLIIGAGPACLGLIVNSLKTNR